MAIGVSLPHAATLLIVGLEGEGRLGGGVEVDGMSDASGRRREALLVARPMLVFGDNWGVLRHWTIMGLFILRCPGAEREKPTLVGPSVVDDGRVYCWWAGVDVTIVGSAAVGDICWVRRWARSGGSLLGAPPGRFIYLFYGRPTTALPATRRLWIPSPCREWLIAAKTVGYCFRKRTTYINELDKRR